jgi:hypothetical protein
MKKILMIGLAVLFAAGTMSAQNKNPPDIGPGSRPGFALPEQESISGNLGISRGMLSLESGGSRYYVMGLNRFIGFIDGLKEGAAVGLTGYAFETPRLSGAKIFRVTELRLNGKSYDLAPPEGNFYSPENRSQNRDFPRCGNFRFPDKGPGGRSGSRDWGIGPDHRGRGGPEHRPDHHRGPRRD